MNDKKMHAAQDKKNNFVMWIFMSFIGYLLIAEHWAHIVPYLPYLIFLLCPFMHFFMHKGHGGHENNHVSHEDSSSGEEK